MKVGYGLNHGREPETANNINSSLFCLVIVDNCRLVIRALASMLLPQLATVPWNRSTISSLSLSPSEAHHFHVVGVVTGRPRREEDDISCARSGTGAPAAASIAASTSNSGHERHRSLAEMPATDCSTNFIEPAGNKTSLGDRERFTGWLRSAI